MTISVIHQEGNDWVWNLSVNKAQALKELDYSQLCGKDSNSLAEKYLCCRAQLILGQIENAETQIRQLKPDDALSNAVKQFLVLQHLVYSEPHTNLLAENLYKLTAELAPIPFLNAELHFILGYLHNLTDEFKAGIKHHRIAADLYTQCDLPGQATHALVNLYVAYTHINEKVLALRTSEQLEQLTLKYPLPIYRLPLLRLQSYREIEKECFSEAIPFLQEWERLSNVLQRNRDRGSALSLLGYVCLVTNTWENAFRWKEFGGHESTPLTTEHTRIFQELTKLSLTPLIDKKSAMNLLAQWKRNNIPNTYFLFFIHVLLLRIEKTTDFETLLWLTRKAIALSVRSQQAVSIQIFRYFEILALIHLGQAEQAKRQLSSFEQVAAMEGNTNRLKQAQFLKIRMKESCSLESSINRWTEGKNSFVVFLESEQVRVGDTLISFTQQPLLFKALLALLNSKKPLSLAELFESVYQSPFHPLMHGQRMHSLLGRLRRRLGIPDAILRRGGKVEVSPTISYHLEKRLSPTFGTDRRRAKLIQIVSHSKSPVTISELEPLFPFTRRTLQLDLKHLVSHKHLSMTPGTKSRRYFAGGLA